MTLPVASHGGFCKGFAKSGNTDIWIYDLTYKILERLTFSDSTDALPVWTSDGKRIIFRSTREKPGIYIKAADGTGEAEQIALETTQGFLPFSLSGDGNTLVMQQFLGLTQIDIGTLSMEDDHTHKPLLQENYIEAMPQVSPDGKYYCRIVNSLFEKNTQTISCLRRQAPRES